MSHARGVVYKSEILGVAVQFMRASRGGMRPMGNQNTIGFLSNTGSEPTKTHKAIYPPTSISFYKKKNAKLIQIVIVLSKGNIGL